MVAATDELFVGKVGNVWMPAFGTAAPFTIPPSGSFNIASAVLPAAWLAADLGYLHESDTPEFAFNVNTTNITAWQANGNVVRTLMNNKIRSVKFTCRAFNRRVWEIMEPGTTWTAGASGSFSGSIPSNGGNPPRAGLFEITDLDNNTKVWFYIPRMTVSSLGTFKAQNSDTLNAIFELNFEVVNSTDPLYYVVGNHTGLDA